MKDDQKIVIYQTPDGKTQIDVRLEDETVWLTQTQNSRGDRYLGYTQAESVPVTNFPCKDFVMHKNGKVCKNGRFIDY